MTLKQIVILLVLAGAAYFAYIQFVPQDKVNDATTLDHWQRGDVAFTPGQWEVVIEQYEAALKENPKDPRAPMAEFRIATAHFRLKHNSQALAAYRALIAKYPDHEDKVLIKKRISEYEGLGIK